MSNEILQREKTLHSKNYLLKMTCSHAKVSSKSAPQKLNFVITNSYALDYSCKCSCRFPHTYA